MMTPEGLLKDLGISKPSEIELDVIAWHCGLQIQYRPLQGCDARVVGLGDKGLLTIDSRQMPVRQRFSIAHELGHWQLHRGQLMMCRAEEIESTKAVARSYEKDADAFAAAVLMPAYLFGPAADQFARNEPWARVASLAAEFQTSTLATALRIVRLGIWPGWLICHGKAGRQWYFSAPQALHEAAPRTDLDPRSPSFDLLFGNIETSRPRKLVGDTWFTSRNAERKTVLEHSRKYGPSEVLSLVKFED